MSKSNLMSENYIHAYLDEQLSTLQASEVSEYLHTNKELFDEIESYRLINNEIHKLYDSILDEAAPEFLLEILNTTANTDNSTSGINDIDELLESDRDYFRQWEDNDVNFSAPKEQNPVQTKESTKQESTIAKPPKSESPKPEPSKPSSTNSDKIKSIPDRKKKLIPQDLGPAVAKFDAMNADLKENDEPDEMESPTAANRIRLESAIEKLGQASNKKLPENSAGKLSLAETYLQAQGITDSTEDSFSIKPDSNKVPIKEKAISKSLEPQKIGATKSNSAGFSLPENLDKMLEKDITLLEQKAKYLGHQPSQNKAFGDSSKFALPGFLRTSKSSGLNGPTIATIWILMCLTLGWFLYNSLINPSDDESAIITRYAIDAHKVYSREALYAVEMDATNKTELSNWLSSRLDGSISTADLNSVGYELMGGRLLPAMGKNAAFFMYSNNKNERISVFISNISKNDKQAWFDCEFTSTTSVCSWLSDKLSFRVVGDQPLVELQLIAKVIYQQMPHL